MSFTGDVKIEISRRPVRRECCIRSACFGFACFASSFGETGLVINTSRQEVARTAQHLFSRLGIRGGTTARGTPGGGERSTFSVEDPFAVRKMLAEFGLSGHEPSLRLDTSLFQCEDCFGHFLAAAFLCGGDVQDTASGSRLEFSSPRRSLMRDLADELAGQGFAPHLSARGAEAVLYFRQGTQVEDLLARMGATNASLTVIQNKMLREVRNRANRRTNCETANIDRTVKAVTGVCGAIAALRRAGRFETLPAELREAAILREKYPEYTLSELGAMLEPPLSRAGVCHRLRKLTDLAAGIGGETREQK